MSALGTATSPSPTARARARRAYPDSKGFQGAFIKGWYARLGRQSRDACPYRGRFYKRDQREGGTFTFAWRAAWLLGYDARATAEAR